MELKFRCSGCGSKLAANSTLVGVEVECPRCRTKVVVPQPSLQQGDMVGGFQVDHLLGMGAMGEVFLAKQMSMDRPVALKVLASDQVEDEESVEFFRNEVRTLARLDHPNIVGAFEAGEQNGKHYLAMTYVDGESLAERVDRDGAMDEKDALRIVLKVARALEYAWDKFRMLHRDVKPANIMLDNYGDVKLMDLGLAKNFSQENSAGQERFAYGTPDYMSPEQIRAVNSADFRTDIYALGATLYHLVTGVPPFVAPTAEEVVAMHLNEPPPSAHLAQAGVSETSSRMIKRMLAKDPEDRHPSWEAVIAEIRRTLKALDSGKAGQVSAPKKKNKTITNMDDAPAYSRPVRVEPPKSKGAVTLVIGLVAVALLAVVGWYVVQPLLAGSEKADPLNTTPEVVTPEVPVENGTDPAHKDPGTKPKTDEELAAEYDHEMIELLNEARRYEAANIGDHEGIIRRYQAVVDRGSGTPQGIAAYEEVQRVGQVRDSLVAGVMRELGERTGGMVEREDYYAAAKVYRSYEGPMAELTLDARNDLARHYSILGRKKAQAEEREQSEANDKLNETLDALVNMLWQQQFTLLERRLDQARKDPALTPVADAGKPAFDILAEAANYPRRVVRNLSDAGKSGDPVTIRLQNESVTVTIQGIDGSKVRCKKKVKIGASEGWIGAAFDLRELHYTELVARQTTTADDDGQRLARLVILAAAKRESEAEGLLDTFEGPLGEALQRRWAEEHAALQDVPLQNNAVDPPPDQAPGDIPRKGLVAWLDGNRGLNANGPARRVSTWADQSENRNHATQGVPQRQPAAYILPGNVSAGVEVRNSDRGQAFLALDAGLVNGKSAVTFVIAFTTEDKRSFDASDRVFGMESLDGDFFRLDFWGAGQPGRPSFTLGLGNKKTATVAGPRVQRQGRSTTIITIVATDGNVFMRQNGELGVANRNRWDDGRIHASGSLFIGSSSLGGNPTGSFSGAVHEVILYDRVLEDAEIGSIEQALARKYGVTLER